MQVMDLTCCGLKELDEVSMHKPEEFLRKLTGLKHPYHFSSLTTWTPRFEHDRFACGAFIFTQAGRHQYGTRLKTYIEQYKLGTVHEVPRFRNPNTGHIIRMFVWTFDFQAIKQWYDAKLRKIPERVKSSTVGQ